MLILSELVVQILGGLLRLLELLVVLMSNVAVAAPQALQPGYGLSLADVLTRPVRAAVRHPWRLGVVLIVAAICVAAAWRS